MAEIAAVSDTVRPVETLLVVDAMTGEEPSRSPRRSKRRSR
jgi:signal recognition particle GTPase